MVGVPYTDDMIAQRDCRSRSAGGLRRPGRRRDWRSAIRTRSVARLAGKAGRLTEVDALIAYLQMLGRWSTSSSTTTKPTFAEARPCRRPIRSSRSFVADLGPHYFFVLFVTVLVYALWPSRQKQFDEAARMPLRRTKKCPLKKNTIPSAVAQIGTTGHEWDGIQRAQYAAAALVAVAVLRDDHLGHRLLDRLSGMAARFVLQQGGTQLACTHRSRDELAALQAQRGPMMTRLATASLNEIEKTPEPAEFARAEGARRSRRIAHPVTGPARRGRAAIPISTPTDGTGA